MDSQPAPAKTVVRLPPSGRDVAPEPPPAPARRRQSQTEHGPFVPLLLGGLALLGGLGFQTLQLWMDREALKSAHAQQQLTVDNAGKLRTSLDTLAADTQRMADAGNPNARVLVEELKKRGVTINAAAPAAPR